MTTSNEPHTDGAESAGPPAAKDVISQADRVRTEVGELLGALATAERDATAAHEAERERIIFAQLVQMPIEALSHASTGRLRTNLVEAAGFRSVELIRRAGRAELEAIPGVGPKTATQLVAAADQVEAALRETVRVRFDVDARPPTQTELLLSLRRLDVVRRNVGPLRPRLDTLAASIEHDIVAARLHARPVRRFFARRRRKDAAAAAFERMSLLLSHADTIELGYEVAEVNDRLDAADAGPSTVWGDYLERPVAYNELLIETTGLGPDAEAAQGFLPHEIAETISAFELDVSLLDVSLRGYQAFGAKFALAQHRTILGDEMGLGKTIEALAVLCHLRSRGATHFLIVMPASVLANWQHEIAHRTRLGPIWVLHGSRRHHSFEAWAGRGGVALTTFGTLSRFGVPAFDIDAAVVDEAHYVKNPRTKRTAAVRSWLLRSEHALLMSGTPMENRVEEFCNLVAYIQPDLAAAIDTTAGVFGAEAFRKRVASVYLRRNQTDVLEELPPKIETAEWLILRGAAADAYRRAVAERNFMAMRRAAFMTTRPMDSPKLVRLLEIVDEAMDNGRKVVVFSFFRDVLARVHESLGERAFGPLTGSVPAAERQRMIDRFSARTEPAVLVSQIEVGGVGLNIQTASVVILTEPQWKPSTEEQAIARCHRMGQIRPVEVHRLLTEDSVDERMLATLASKSELFAEYVRASALKEATPAAIDVTDAASTMAVASQVEQERQIIELEYQRLGIGA